MEFDALFEIGVILIPGLVQIVKSAFDMTPKELARAVALWASSGVAGLLMVSYYYGFENRLMVYGFVFGLAVSGVVGLGKEELRKLRPESK